MSVQIQSTSDSKEAVTAAMGDLASDKPVVEKPVEEKQVEESEETSEETENEAPKTEEENEEESEEVVEAKKDEQKPKKKGGFQKKIDKLSQKVLQAEQEREYWRQEALRAKPVQIDNPKTVEEKPDLSKRPKADDFKTVDEYQEALTDWKVDQRMNAERQKSIEENVKKEVQAKFNKHHERVVEFKKTNEDFEDEWNDAVKEVGETNLSLTVREVIVNSEMGPELMKELADDPKEFKRICGLSAINAAKELGKIEARLTKSSTSTEETKTKTKVPAPIKTVRTKGGTTPIGYREDMTQKEYEAWRNQSSKRA